MKTTLPTLALLLTLGTGVAAFTTGCAGTATQASTGEYIDDRATTAKVKAAMVRDPIVKALDVNVDTFRSVVQLSGFVETEEQKARAGQIAAGVQGVQSVQNNITLRTTATNP